VGWRGIRYRSGRSGNREFIVRKCVELRAKGIPDQKVRSRIGV
jgi:hypothetical protein